MKKIIKINIVLIILILISFTSTTFADKLDPQSINIKNSLRNEATALGNPILGAIKVVGIFVSVIMLMVVGIKYMVGSVEEKAEYKQTAIIYVIGAILIFATTAVINLIYNVFN